MDPAYLISDRANEILAAIRYYIESVLVTVSRRDYTRPIMAKLKFISDLSLLLLQRIDMKCTIRLRNDYKKSAREPQTRAMRSSPSMFR